MIYFCKNLACLYYEHLGVLTIVINKQIKGFFCLLLMGFSITIHAQLPTTHRISQIENDAVHVWKTIIYPTKKAQLTMHRHDNNRVVVALTNGLLKVTNNQGHVHYLKLKKGMSYYLKKDPKNELHVDENMSGHVVKVIVIELCAMHAR